MILFYIFCSNNTNKLSPQELLTLATIESKSSNNTNKLSPQEQGRAVKDAHMRSNNTNKLSPQEPYIIALIIYIVQIIQINLALKNDNYRSFRLSCVQIIQINLALKNKDGL